MRKILSVSVALVIALVAGVGYAADEMKQIVILSGQTNTTMTVGLSKIDTSLQFEPYALGYPNPRSGSRQGYGNNRNYRVVPDSIGFQFHATSASGVGDSVGFVPHFIGRSELPQTAGSYSNWHAVITPTDSVNAALTAGENAVFYYTIGLQEVIATQAAAGDNVTGWPDQMAVILRTVGGTATVNDTATVRIRAQMWKYEP